MDDNTRQVLVALIGVAGTLGGIGVGWVLQGRRQDREAAASAVQGTWQRRSIERADT